jgi:hypothetical protein
MRLLLRRMGGKTQSYLVVMYCDNDKVDEAKKEYGVEPILISVNVDELAARQMSPLMAKDVEDLHPVLVQGLNSSLAEETQVTEVSLAVPSRDLIPEQNQTQQKQPARDACFQPSTTASESIKLVTISARAKTSVSGNLGGSDSQPEGVEEKKLCEVCEKPGRLCMRCREVAYCGKEHQMRDWKRHKKNCRVRS